MGCHSYSLLRDLGGASFDRDYAYDGMDRLAADGGVAYAYDAAGNRMTRTEDGETVTYSLGAGDRRLVPVRRGGMRDAHHARRGHVGSDVERPVPACLGLHQRRVRGGVFVRRARASRDDA